MEMSKEMIQEIIINVIAGVFEDDEVKSKITADSDLINDVGLDSIQLVTMILSLEDHLDVVIDFDEFDFDEIKTIGQLTEFVQKL